jgi:hypothetical protein
MSEDVLVTWEKLIERWLIDGPTEKAKLKKVQRRARDLGLKPFTGPRQRPALIRPADVLRAEQKGAERR